MDLSREKAEGILWNEAIQALVIKRLLEGVNLVAVSPLSFGGTPLFFNAFDTADAFLDANRLTALCSHP